MITIIIKYWNEASMLFLTKILRQSSTLPSIFNRGDSLAVGCTCSKMKIARTRGDRRRPSIWNMTDVSVSRTIDPSTVALARSTAVASRTSPRRFRSSSAVQATRPSSKTTCGLRTAFARPVATAAKTDDQEMGHYLGM